MPKLITEPGIYEMPAAEHHKDPCFTPSLSNSIGKILVNPGGTPMHAAHEHPRLNLNYTAKESDAFDLGTAAHALMLGDPVLFEIIPAPNWASKAAKEARETARAAGKIALLSEQWHRVQEMVSAGRRQLDDHEDAFDAFKNGKPEQSLFWRENDVWCRARLDWLPNARRVFDDYKTTSASADPDLWERTMLGMGFDFQAAFYMRGIRALGICDRPIFRFVVQENYPPYALSVVSLAPSALDLAERDVQRAISIWRHCLTTDRWRGYPRRTCFIEQPAWREAQKMEREDRDAAITAAELQVVIKSQEPL